eukprot:3725231-Prymnesium_polylepis.1
MLGLQERIRENIMLVCTSAADDRVVGFVEVYTPEYLASQSSSGYPERVRQALKPYVASLAVDASSTRQGVGTALMLAAERRAREETHRSVSLEVEESNAAALALYSKLGYR